MSNDKVKKEGSFTEKYKELWKFIKFSIVGFSSTLVEMGVFYLLQYVVFKGILYSPIPETWPQWLKSVLALIGQTEGTGLLYAYVISTTIGYIIAFILNRKTTFKADSNVALSTFLYVLMVIFTILATAWIGTQFQLFMAAKDLQSIGDAVGKPLAAALATLWTYPLNRFVIHRHKGSSDEAEAK